MISKEFLILRMISFCTWLFSLLQILYNDYHQKDNSTSKTLYWFICFLVFSLSPSLFWFCLLFSLQTSNDVYIKLWKLLEVSRIGLNLERHPLASKVTPLGRICNFQGNCVHPDNFIYRKFLHESCRTFCYLSKPT